MEEQKLRWEKLELVFNPKSICSRHIPFFENIENQKYTSKYDQTPFDKGEGNFRVYLYPLKFFTQNKEDIKTAVKEFQKKIEKACKNVNIEKDNNAVKCPVVFIKNGEKFFDGSIRCMDFIKSSIWNYFWDPQEADAEEQINWILTEIQRNYEEGRYDLTVAKEYAEFNYRLILNSNLSFDDHSVAVSPFLFHSERRMESWVNVTEERNHVKQESLLHSLNWRLLLVDDHPDDQDPMKSSQGLKIGKIEIIKDNLKRININKFVQSSDIDKDRESINLPYIEFDYAKTVDDAFEKIKKYKYDIILLDYKLDEIKNEKEITKYGYELLTKIKDDQERTDGIIPELTPGPNDTFYFMFISAYTTAVQERLQMEGFYVSKDYWFIGRGACPTNTPYLFLYCLKRMMDIRYDKLTKHSKQLLKDLNKQKGTLTDKDIETEKGKYATMTMFLTKLYEKDNERNNCVIGFNAFLNLRRVYDTIKHDVDHSSKQEERRMKSSPLILSLFKDEEFCSNSFWEHLQNLVYLTAFGTIRQWPEMWEDYIFIKGKLEKAESEYESYWAVNKYTKPSILIRDYILSLKGMMS